MISRSQWMIRVLVVVASLVASVIAQAKPLITIKTYPGGKPIRLVIETHNTLAAAPVDPLKALLQAQWPLTTQLRVGQVSAKPLPKAMVNAIETPLFLIGADAYSQHWLAHNKQRLLTLHATGVLVEAKNSATYQYMAQRSQPLTLHTFSVDDLAQQLGIQYYPVLISNAGITP